MADSQQPAPVPASSDAEAEIWNAISYFEKILEALPADRLSLETLVSAYEKVGDHTRARDYTLRLARVLIDEADEDGAEELLARLRLLAPSDAAVAETIARLEALKPPKVMAEVLDDKNPLARRSANIAGEISLAWNLLQGNKLHQEDYSRVVHDLSENSSRAQDVPVSTLHVLHDRHHPGFNEILAFLATACNTPLIALERFEIPPAAASLLPLPFCIKRGVVVFDLMGRDALMAVLNPYDTQVLQDVEEMTGRSCHRFLAAPADFDAAMERLKAMTSA